MTPEERSRKEPPATGSGTTAPRSLAESLRARDDASLAALLRARPDLVAPVPTDLTQLATRAATRASVVRALERLDTFALQTAEALAVAADPASYDALLGLMAGDGGHRVGTSADAVPATSADAVIGTMADTAAGTSAGASGPVVAEALPRALAALREQALVWGSDDCLRLVRTARELLAPSPQHPSPTGLGPTVAEAAAAMSPGRIQEILTAAGLPTTHDTVSAVTLLTGLFTDRTRMAALLDTAPADSLEVLSRLVWGPPYGQVTAAPAPRLRWLLDRGLLLPTAPGTVVLPREVALHLRGGRAHRRPEPLPPAVEAAATHRPQMVDATAAGQAYTALATVEELLKDWDEGGPPVLRAGGLSVRDLKRTAVALDVSEPVAAFWVELAYAAGLLASDGEADERYAATPAYDEWRELPAAERWSRLATAWLAATRTPGLVGGRDAKDRALSALGPGLDRSAAPEVRHRVLTLLSGLPEGTAPAPESVPARLRWERPLRGAQPTADDLRTRLARWTLSEAELLGVTGRGALSAHGRALLGEHPDHPPAPAQPVSGPPAPTHPVPEPATPAQPVSGPPAPTHPVPEPATPAQPVSGPPAPAHPVPGPEAPAHPVPGPEAPAQPVSGLPAPTHPVSRPAVPGATPTGPGDKLPVHRQYHRPGLREPLTAPERAAAAARAARLLAPLLPEPLDHVLLQADLTAVAPGPLRRPLADMLGVLADVESKGGATVYRFTPATVRRALDAGRTASDLHAFLVTHSRTPVPQPLTYLIDDVARRHGHLRVGAASAYVRCDDDALLNEIVADKRAAALRLRRLAPTVLAAEADPATLLDGLRAMGFAPAAESAEGDVLITRAHAHRTPPRTPPEPVPEGPPAPDAALLTAALRAIRAGDLASTAPRKPAGAPTAAGELPRTTSAETLATMQAAVMTGESVWIGYVNAEGAATQRLIAPVRVEGGFVTAYDHTADEVRTYPLHRVTGVAELADDQL